MRSHKILAIAGRMIVAAVFSVLLIDVLPVMALFVNQPNDPASLKKIRSIAEAQHEIVVILINKKEYAKAVAEANKIFTMKWPDPQEPLLVKEMLNLTKKFLSSGQAHSGLKLIEGNLGRFKTPSSQAALWKEKGYLHESLNQLDAAHDCFKKAIDLEAGK